MKSLKSYVLLSKTFYLFVLCLISNQIISQTTFIESQNLPSTFPTAAELVDLDNDGDLDLIRTMDRAIGINDLNANEVWLNDGSGNYTLHQSFGNSQSNGLATGDIDDDDDIDIFIANATNFIGPSSVSSNKVWLNDGSANFTSNGQSLGFSTSSAVTLADFDGDNDLDAYIANSSYPNTVWINNGAGQFTDSGQLLGYHNTQDVFHADIDNDNDIDVITANIGNTDTANIVWLNNGSGGFSNNQELGSFWTRKLSIADLDGDNDLDVVFSNTYDNSTAYVNDGTGNFSFHSNIIGLTTAQPKTIRFSDVDNDGDNDLVVGIWSYTNENRILINDGVGNFTEDYLLMVSNAKDVAIGDIDNDGDEDIFILNINNQNNRFWLNQKILNVDEYNSSFIKVYPNPVLENFTIELDRTYKNIEVNIYNMLSQKIYTQKINSTRLINLPLNGPKGIYFIETKIDNIKQSVNKLIKE